jgi:hypothetical protein
MAPGLCYLAVNGGEFLAHANNLLTKNKHQQGSGVTQADLPVDGNANQVMSNATVVVDIESGQKPFWWYLAGFPIWCKIATVGRQNMTRRINQEGEMSSSTPQDNVSEENALVPNGREFCIAIFFVIFGLVAVIAGVGSNIYVQINA